MTASRITGRRVEWISERLGRRDLELIRSLDRVRVATTRQLERLHFTDGTALSNARSCRASLTRLSRWGVLSRLERRVGGVRAGSAAFVYSLGAAGQRLAGNGGVAGGKRHQTPWTPSTSFLKHRLAVTEVYVGLVEAARMGGPMLTQFQSEPRCWRAFPGQFGEAVTLKPDAFVQLEGANYVDHVFVEVDLGTESRRALSAKFDRYRGYWAAGVEQRVYGLFPRVVWLVPDRARYDVVVDVVGRQPAEAWQLFRVGELHEAVHVLTKDGDV